MSEQPVQCADAEEPTLSGHLLPGRSSFRPDPYLYRSLLPGQDFLDADKFVTYAEMVQRIRASRKRVILSIGESGTSGWDTRITPINRERRQKGLPLYSAFFRYKNYTDMLRDRVGDEFEVVNAGVPGHTALSGLRRYGLLQDRFQADGIAVEYVVFHFGNNDGLWEGNLVDRRHLHLRPVSWPLVENLRLRWHRRPSDRMELRSSVHDYGFYHREMVRLARRHGARPILMQPEIPLYWEPGRRLAAFDFDHLATLKGASFALAKLEQAKQLWASVIDKPYSAEKIATLQQAVELDHILPRIKQAYSRELQRIANEENVPLVHADVPRERDDSEFFLDYCHPRENVNAALADAIVRHL